MKTSKLTSFIASSLVSALLPLSARTDEAYPKPVPMRYHGQVQGRIGSCEAEAAVSALEHAFAHRGMSVKFSTYYTHAKFRFNDRRGSMDQDYDDGPDKAVFEALGGVVPAYMLPEDSRGLSFNDWGDRETISSTIVNVSNFPSSDTYGFSDTRRPFRWGYNDEFHDFDALKKMLAERKPVTLSLRADVLDDMDDETGMLKKPYSFEALSAKIRARVKGKDTGRTNHRVALVGFDDGLYKDHNYPGGAGAFIIRNSNVRNDDLPGIMKPFPGGDARFGMRRKISPTLNMPGYYALPYQYVRDLMEKTWPLQSERADGAIGVLTIDYDRFFELYTQHESQYEVLRAPFRCIWSKAVAALKTYKKNVALLEAGQEPQASQARREITEMLKDQRTAGDKATFRTAVLTRARNGSVDRIREFYSGKFNAYYCEGREGLPMPSAVLNSPELLDRLREITADPTGLGPWMRYYDFMVATLKL